MRDARLYLAARGLSVLGLQLIVTTFVLSALAQRADALFLGNLGLCATLASLGSTFFLGHWVDRMGQSRALRLSQSLLVGFGIFLAVVPAGPRALFLLWASVLSVLRNFRSIAQFSVFGRVLKGVERPEKWVNLSTLSWQLAFFVAPLLAGLLNRYASAAAAYATAAVCLLAGFLCQRPLLRRLPRLVKPVAAPDSVGDSFRRVKEFFRGHARLRRALLLDFVVVFFAGASAMLPFLGGGRASALQVGFLRAAMPLGVIVGTLWVLKRPVARHWHGGLFVATLGFALFHLGLAFSPGVALGCGLLVGAGFCDALSLSIREVLLQGETPAALKGRVYAVNNFLVNASDELSEWESGVGAHFLGIRRAIVLGSSLTAAASFAFWRQRETAPAAAAVSERLAWPT